MGELVGVRVGAAPVTWMAALVVVTGTRSPMPSRTSTSLRPSPPVPLTPSRARRVMTKASASPTGTTCGGVVFVPRFSSTPVSFADVIASALVCGRMPTRMGAVPVGDGLYAAPPFTSTTSNRPRANTRSVPAPCVVESTVCMTFMSNCVPGATQETAGSMRSVPAAASALRAGVNMAVRTVMKMERDASATKADPNLTWRADVTNPPLLGWYASKNAHAIAFANARSGSPRPASRSGWYGRDCRFGL